MAGVSHPNSTDFLVSYQLWLHPRVIIKNNKSPLWSKFSSIYATAAGLAPLKRTERSLSSRVGNECGCNICSSRKETPSYTCARTYLLHIKLTERFPLERRGNKLLSLQEMTFCAKQDFPHREKNVCQKCSKEKTDGSCFVLHLPQPAHCALGDL